MDVWILILPYNIIITIPRPLRERLAVYSIFGLGFFGTICAIVRFNYLVIVNNSRDPFYDSLPINTWSIIEVNVGMACASLPTLRPLFSKSQRRRTREALKSPDEEATIEERNDTKRRGLLQVKEMFITINTDTFRDSKASTASNSDSGWKSVKEYPPPVPPKDVKVPKMKHPEVAYRRI